MNAEDAEPADAQLQRSALRISTSILALQRRAEQQLLETQHALQEQAHELARSNGLLHTILESSPAGIVAVGQLGQVTAFNSKIVDMWGVPPDVQARADFGEWARVLAAGARERLPVIARLRRLSRAWSEVHGTIEMRDGRTLEYASAPHLQDGESTGVVLHCRDVSERRRETLASEALQEQLRESQKMESIGALAGGIAHDFNNILGAILGNTVLAAHTVAEDHPAAESLVAIQAAAERATRLVQQILTFSRRQRQQVQRVSLGALLMETVGLLRATIPTGIEITVDVDDAASDIMGDPTQLLQVMMNLGTNAMRAVQERTGKHGGAGHIAFRVRQERGAGLGGRPASLTGARYVVLEVTDDGIGMDAATRERMFEPFFTTRGVGTGLGLSVVHGILAAHDGGIAVNTVPGQGTSITAYFPAAPLPDTPVLPHTATSDADASAASSDGVGVRVETSAVGARVAQTGSSTRDGRRHVIVVDDEPMLVSIATRLLEGAGYRVTGFTDAHAALDTVRDAIGDVDALITDFNMPRISGLEVAQEVRTWSADLPIIISSGFLTQELEAQALSANVQVIEKTSLVTTLVKVVGAALAPQQNS